VVGRRAYAFGPYRDELPDEIREDFGAEVLVIVEGCSQDKVSGETARQRR
jgi:hypothetical protein